MDHSFRTFQKQWEFDHQTSSEQQNSWISCQNGSENFDQSQKSKDWCISRYPGPAEHIFIRFGWESSTGNDGLKDKCLVTSGCGLLQPESSNRWAELIAEQKLRQAYYCDKLTKDLFKLYVSEQIWIQPVEWHNKEWKKTEVKSQLDTRSFEMVTQEDQVLRRNQRQLWHSNQPVHSD